MTMRFGLIDLGSNSIKLLLVDAQAPASALDEHTLEVRISGGIGTAAQLVFSEETLSRAVAAVAKLVQRAQARGALKVYAVATSAVREAGNRQVLIDQLKQQLGLQLEVLSGEQEACGIAQGVMRDPQLGISSQPLCIWDMGGGSLECIQMERGQLLSLRSLPLGAVRLKERCGLDTTGTLGEAAAGAITEHVDAVLAKHELVPRAGALWVGCGGAFSVSRGIRAAWLGQSYEASSPSLSMTFLNCLSEALNALPIDARARVPHLPPSRADVLPVALIALRHLADRAGVQAFQHSLFNLRAGLAHAVAKHWATTGQLPTSIKETGLGSKP
jgi:exopolyphosphatase/guanosine-5'-triphosphate,3'-diphosphate pyrophosphatase